MEIQTTALISNIGREVTFAAARALDFSNASEGLDRLVASMLVRRKIRLFVVGVPPFTVVDLEVIARHGSGAGYYYVVAQGIADRSVRAHRVGKSMGAENTFPETPMRSSSSRNASDPSKVWTASETKGAR